MVAGACLQPTCLAFYVGTEDLSPPHGCLAAALPNKPSRCRTLPLKNPILLLHNSLRKVLPVDLCVQGKLEALWKSPVTCCQGLLSCLFSYSVCVISFSLSIWNHCVFLHRTVNLLCHFICMWCLHIPTFICVARIPLSCSWHRFLLSLASPLFLSVLFIILLLPSCSGLQMKGRHMALHFYIT